MNTPHLLKTLSITNCLSLTPKLRNLRNVRYMSNEPAVQREFTEKGLRPKREQRRKPKIEPFAKNLFCGKVDTNIIPFPEVLNKEELHNLSEVIAPAENSIHEIIKNDSNIDYNKLVDILNSCEAFGINVPFEYGGCALNVTETCRFKEIQWKDWNLGYKISHILGNGVQALLDLGTATQKQTYLSKICIGHCTPVICFHESDQNVLQIFRTRAKLGADRNTWLLSGEKIIYSMIKDTDLLLVFTTISIVDHTGETVDTVKIFLVDSNMPGVKKTKVNDNYYKVSFNDVAVPIDNILAKDEHGLELALKLMIQPRLSVGIASSAIIKDLLSKLSNHLIHSNGLDKCERVQEKLGEMACSVYAIDSMIYLTAGLLDGYDDPDCIMESAMLKVYSSQVGLDALLSSIQLLGPDNYFSSSNSMNRMQGMINYQILDESNDNLRLLIGMMGLQHAGHNLAYMVKKVRNPLLYPGFLFKRMLNKRRHDNDNPKLTLCLADDLHPSLTEAAEQLEYCVLKLQYLSEMVLIRNGAETPHKQMEINKIAIVAIEIYAMFCSVSRASRSYCIGHLLGHYELYLANAICRQGLHKVKTVLGELERGPYYSNDSYYIKISKQVCKSSGDFTQHPLATNF